MQQSFDFPASHANISLPLDLLSFSDHCFKQTGRTFELGEEIRPSVDSGCTSPVTRLHPTSDRTNNSENSTTVRVRRAPPVSEETRKFASKYWEVAEPMRFVYQSTYSVLDT